MSLTKKEKEALSVSVLPPAPDKEKYTKKIEKISDILMTKRDKQFLKNLKSGKDIYSADDPKKFKIIREFIKRKGSILYGGTALNLNLIGKDKFYKRSELPDYDFFSTQPWDDAVELADILYNAGYDKVEVRSGIHPGTFKVFVNFWPAADITYIPKKAYNVIPTKKIRGLTVAKPEFLEIDLYKELSESYFNPSRWPKLAYRQKLIEHRHPLKGGKGCVKTFTRDPKKTVSESRQKMIKIINKYAGQNKMLHFGPLAYNLRVKAADGKLFMKEDHVSLVVEEAQKYFKNIYSLLDTTGIQTAVTVEYIPYKPVSNVIYTLFINGIPLMEISESNRCLPYQVVGRDYIAGIDYLKYELFFSLNFGTQKVKKQSRCYLVYLTNLQQKYYRKNKKSEMDKSLFQRFIPRCIGPAKSEVKYALLERWVDKEERDKEITTVSPKTKEYELKNVEGRVVKIYPRTTKLGTMCRKKKLGECEYPCRVDGKKCLAIPKKPYRAGRKK